MKLRRALPSSPMMPVTDNPVSLVSDVTTMIAAELPRIARLGEVFAAVSTEVDSDDPGKIHLVIQPIDFNREPIEITASVRIVGAVVREPRTAAITAAAPTHGRRSIS